MSTGVVKTNGAGEKKKKKKKKKKKEKEKKERRLNGRAEALEWDRMARKGCCDRGFCFKWF